MVKEKLFHKVTFTDNNVKKLAKGEPTLFKHSQLVDGDTPLVVSPLKFKKIQRAMVKGKGVKISLSPEEWKLTNEQSGGKLSWKGFKRAFKKAADKVGDAFEDAAKKTGKAMKEEVAPALKTGWEGYKKYVKPVVGPEIRKGLKTALKVGLPAAAVALGQPELVPIAAYAADKLGSRAIDQIGNHTGGFGLKRVALQEDWNTFLSASHPAYSPTLPGPDHSMPRHVISGTSFRPAGGSLTSHQAHNPLMSQGDHSVVRRRGGSFLSV